MSAADTTERTAWQEFLGAVGKATGIVAFVYFVGGAIVWERLHVLRLPATQGVEPLPRELLLVVGARALAWPLALGLLAIVAVHALSRLPQPGTRVPVYAVHLKLVRLPPPSTRTLVRATYVTLVGLFGAALGLTVQFETVQQAIFVGCFGLFAGVGLALARVERATPRQVSVGLFVSLALVGVVVEAVDIYRPPVHLEYANVFLSHGKKEVSGFFIGETADTVYIARNKNSHVCGWITALPRSEISRLSILPPEKASRPSSQDPCEFSGPSRKLQSMRPG